MATDPNTTRARLQWAALCLSATQVSPNDETTDPYYDASLKLGEDQVDQAAREHVAALLQARRLVNEDLTTHGH